jgi:hypothetical protein
MVKGTRKALPLGMAFPGFFVEPVRQRQQEELDEEERAYHCIPAAMS